MRDPVRHAFASGTVVTVGTFDGVHLGHRDILRRLHERAEATGLPSLLVTFEPHPLSVVRPASAPRLLTPGEEQADALVDVDPPRWRIVLPFNRTLASWSAERFVVELLRDRYGMRELIVGYDHGFGRGREGDVETLRSLGSTQGFPVHVVEPRLDDEGRPVSSSRIRDEIRSGALDAAAAALGRGYSMRARVVPGSRRGRGLGFPTLNLEPVSAEKLLPPLGVYAVRLISPHGSHGGMLNLGSRPTFGDESVVPEVHLFGADGDWYGLDVRLEFVSRLRDVMRFDGVDALVAQLGQDADAARRALTQP